MSISYEALTGLLNITADNANIANINANNITTTDIAVTSLTANRILATDSLKKIITQNMNNGELLIGNAGGYTSAGLTSGSNIAVTNGAGSVTLATVASPSFTDTTLTSLTPNTLVYADALKKLTSINLTAGTNIAVTNGTGSVSISTVANPSFTSVTSTLGYHSAGSYTVNAAMTTAQIQAVISNTNYSIIRFEYGTYTLASMLNVNRSNLILDGNNSILSLAKFAQDPCIFVGDITTNPPTIRYSNIIIQNFSINGNKGFQSSETSITHPWIYNNAIGVNLCDYVIIQKCELYNARSGGFTATYNSKFITVDSCSAHDNHFDGLTAYGSESVRFVNNMCYSHSNGAGISIDTDILYCVIANNTLNNNNLGLFARFTHDLTFTGNCVSANSTHGIFLSGYNQTPNDQGCYRWTITGNTFNNNGGHGLFLQGCSDFTISGNTIYHNNNGINITSYSGLPFATYGVCSRMNINGNTITGNTNVGFYNDASNSYANGSRDNFLTLNIIKSNTSGQVVGDLSSFTLDDDTVINTNQLTLKQSSGYVTNVAALSGSTNVTFNLPVDNGTVGYVLSTNGSGNTSWIPNPTSTSVYNQICNSGCNIPFPVSYTPSSYVSPMIITITFPAGSFRVIISYNILVAGLGTGVGVYDAYVSDGTNNYAPCYGNVTNGTTTMIHGNSISSTTFSSSTVSFTLHFKNNEYCSLLAASGAGYDPFFNICLI